MVMTCDDWERLWGSYVKALSDLDAAKSRAERKGAWLRVWKVEKKIRRADPDFAMAVIYSTRTS